MAYETTKVSATRSQEQIRKMLRTTGADRVTFGEVMTGEKKAAGLEFHHLGLAVRVVCPFTAVDEKIVRAKASRAYSKSRDDIADELFEQEMCRTWRVIHWSVKARLEAVENGLETFEQAFLPHLVDPRTGMTIWSMVQPAIDAGAMQIDGGEGLGSPLALGRGDSD